MDSPHSLGADQVRQACIETIFFVDAAGYGDFLHATLRKKTRLVNCNSYIAFAVHCSRVSPRTACALAVHPELVEGFFERRREPTVTVD